MTEKSMMEKLARAAADAFMEDYEEAPLLYREVVRAVLVTMRVEGGNLLRAVRMGPWGRNPSVDEQNVAELGWLRGIDHILNESGKPADPI